RRARHELASLSSIVPAKREALEVAVHVIADVIGDALGTELPEVALPELEESLQHGEPHDQAGSVPGQRGWVGLRDASGARAIRHASLDPAVDDLANEAGDEEVDAGGGQQADVGDGDGRPVAAEIAHDAERDLHGRLPARLGNRRQGELALLPGLPTGARSHILAGEHAVFIEKPLDTGEIAVKLMHTVA